MLPGVASFNTTRNNPKNRVFAVCTALQIRVIFGLKLKNYIPMYPVNLTRVPIIVLLICTLFIVQSCKKKEPPTADFTYTATELSVSFTFSGEGEVDSYTWDFGDGNTSTEASPTHVYEEAGTYQVSLTVENANGDDSKSESITVEGGASGQATNPELKFGDADGAFYAINSVSLTTVAGFEIETKVGTAVAWFTDGTKLVSVGEVKWQQGSTSGILTQENDEAAYTWIETAIPPVGFTNDGMTWTIAGGNGFAQVNGLSNLYPFPNAKKIDETSTTISADAAYTLSHSGSINNADSIYFAIYGPEANVIKRADGSATSATISADEMATLGKGSAILQVAAFKIYGQEVDGKKFYMVNEAVASQTVTIE